MTALAPGVLAAPAFAESWPGWARFLMGAPLRIAIILVLAWLTVIVLHAVIKHVTGRMGKRPGRADAARTDAAYAAARRESRFKTLGSVLSSASTVVVWVLAVCLALEAVGVNPGLIITSVGVAGLGLGLGAQSLVKDMLTGLLVLMEDQYGIGDTIDAGPATGVVESMSLRITILRDQDGVLWYLPNGSITRIGNRSQTVAPD
ncbi:MAG: mechanosensitive ion channel family protein [Bifidobacteriaceae bacterium]|jgi:small conductance mechanosensitive channel|nr:mechanosensitive ion channel family protein [Bifidobacteriaceae bacterium]